MFAQHGQVRVISAFRAHYNPAAACSKHVWAPLPSRRCSKTSATTWIYHRCTTQLRRCHFNLLCTWGVCVCSTCAVHNLNEVSNEQNALFFYEFVIAWMCLFKTKEAAGATLGLSLSHQTYAIHPQGPLVWSLDHSTSAELGAVW